MFSFQTSGQSGLIRFPGRSGWPGLAALLAVGAGLGALCMSGCGQLSSGKQGPVLIADGEARSEIVVTGDATPQAQLAARELQEHLEKISGVRLEIVSSPGGGGLLPIFVGESEFTKQLGLGLDGIDGEAHQVVVTPDYVALFGRDEIFPFYPHGYTDASQREQQLREWQEFAGEKFGFPFLALYDPRFFNQEFGFSLWDPSGTLFAVYEFLEQLGVRWFMPGELGMVLPPITEVTAPVQDLTRTPAFARRYLRIGWGKDRDTFLWSKRQKLGMSEMAWMCHGTSLVTAQNKKEHPEYLAVVDGRLQDQGDFGPGQSRFAPPLRDAMVRFGTRFFDRYPELRHFSAAPNDGYTVIDDRDREAGWLRPQFGSRGELSDYVWTFLNEVAAGVAQTHPGKFVMGLAYSRYRMPPGDIEIFHPAVGVTYCQTRAMEMVDPEARQNIFAERQEWLRKLPSQEFYLWEYFLWHRKGTALWGVPVIFTRVMQEDMRALHGVSKGEYVEAWPLQSGEMWGLNHLTIYLQARLYWDPDLDLSALMDEYCALFYGPAAAEMREFFEYAEDVWMRPAPRHTTVMGEDGVPKREGFLQAEDVAPYFEILERARAKAGDGIYGDRIDLILGECEPMRQIFAFQDYFRQGKAAAKAGAGALAAEYLEKAVASANDNRDRANAAYELGKAYRDLLEDNKQALQAFQTVMQTPIEGAGSAVRLHARMDAVRLMREAGRYEEALKLLDEGEGMRRHDYWWARSLAARGTILEAMVRPQEALALYREAVELPDVDAAQAEWLRTQIGRLESAR